MKNFWIYIRPYTLFILALFIAIVFISLRLYRLESSLLFFNDMGRDFLELLEWQQTKIPPLLGPQISVLSFNQSPFYFYLLFPGYLLTSGSAFASTYTIIFWYLAWFAFGVWYFRGDRGKLWQLIVIAFILTIHPEVIRQTRFVWNPSFLPPLIVASLFAHSHLISKWNHKTALVLALTGSLAMALNFSSAPLYIVLILTGIYYFQKNILKLILMFIGSMFIWYLPSLVFELRHNFTLSRLLFTGQTITQSANTIPMKLLGFKKYVIIPNHNSLIIPFIIFTSLIIVGAFIFKSKQKKSKLHQLLYYFLNLILLISLTFILPINVESHYIFGFVTLSAFVISLLPGKVSLVALALLSIIWITPSQLQPQYTVAVRTVPQMQQCYQDFCSEFIHPAYVSMESGIVPFHNAPEHKYLLSKAGCQVLSIEKSQNDAGYMVVIDDNSTYQHGKSAYHELTLFGPADEIDYTSCTPNLGIHLLKKSSYE